jgi:hypothetical protein
MLLCILVIDQAQLSIVGNLGQWRKRLKGPTGWNRLAITLEQLFEALFCSLTVQDQQRGFQY